MPRMMVTSRDVEREAVEKLGCAAAVVFKYECRKWNGRGNEWVMYHGLSIRRTHDDDFESIGRRESLTELLAMIDKLAKSHGKFGLLNLDARWR
jgi:hypothetical protein